MTTAQAEGFRLCSVDGCGGVMHGRGLCDAHRWRLRHGVPLDRPLRYQKPASPCSVVGCKKASQARGLCCGHYYRLNHGIPMDAPLRRMGETLKARVLAGSIPEPNTGCWLWLGPLGPKGYGRLRTDRGLLIVHRASWEAHRGPIPDGLCVLHRCDNPPCVNPDHLFLGTVADNNADKKRKGRARNQHSKSRAAIAALKGGA